LPAAESNLVLGSRDRRGRIYRRITRWNGRGESMQVRVGSVRATACAHEDVEYSPNLQGKTKAEVDDYIRAFADLMRGG
jgi:uncharacterized Zn finger protein